MTKKKFGIDQESVPGSPIPPDDQKLVAPVPTSPLARRTDPATSKESAAILRGSRELGELQDRALRLVREHPGCTAKELTMYAGDLDPRRVNRRLSELKEAELIRTGDFVKDPITNRRCLTWWPV